MVRVTAIALLFVAAAFVCAAPVPPENDAARMARIYGVRANPDDDAKYEMDGEKLRVFLLPREHSPHNYWRPTPEQGSRVWREVTGDFTAVVRVSFKLRSMPQDKNFLPSTAGLVAWVDDKHHVGVVRCESLGKGKKPGTLEIREMFQAMLTEPQRFCTAPEESPREQAGAAFLRLRREGNHLTGGYSRDGKEWTDFLPDEAEWQETLNVGVYVKHSRDTPFEVTFDEYKVTVPKKK